MAKVPTTPANRRGRIKLNVELDRLLAEREQLVGVIAVADSKKAEAIARVERRYQSDVDGAPAKLEEIDAELASFVSRHRYWLTRRLTKTIVRADGEVKEVLRAVELDTPATEKDAVDLLLSRPGGKKYLTVTYKLNRRVLLQAPSDLRAALRPLGFWWGRHRTISVKSSSSDAPKLLVRQRFNERP